MRVLVLGANGQDGSYLCEALLRIGHEVIGLGRDQVSRHVRAQPRFRYYSLDLEDAAKLTEFVTELRPDQCYHFAAVHGATGAGFAYESNWGAMVRVNVLALHVLLEVARTVQPLMRIFYAGSSKIFPPPLHGTINEESPARATCLYSIGKIAARDLLTQYRLDHGIRGTNLILFNHDSPRRPAQYMLAKIASAIAAGKRGTPSSVTVRTLDFWIDWGSAEEFMGIVAELGVAPYVPELVIASGTTVLARDAIDAAFARHGLEAEKHIVEERPRGHPGSDFSVQLSRLEAIGRRPRIQVSQVIDAIVDANS